MFWAACENYKRSPSIDERRSLAEGLVNQYVRMGAPSEVNVRQESRTPLLRKDIIDEAKVDLFDIVQYAIEEKRKGMLETFAFNCCSCGFLLICSLLKLNFSSFSYFCYFVRFFTFFLIFFSHLFSIGVKCICLW